MACIPGLSQKADSVTWRSRQIINAHPFLFNVYVHNFFWTVEPEWKRVTQPFADD